MNQTSSPVLAFAHWRNEPDPLFSCVGAVGERGPIAEVCPEARDGVVPARNRPRRAAAAVAGTRARDTALTGSAPRTVDAEVWARRCGYGTEAPNS